MATSIAFTGYGVAFGYGDGSSSESFTDFAEVISVGTPALQRDLIDISHASSPNQYREFKAGFIDGGEVSMEFNMVQADYAILQGKMEDSQTTNYKITIPDDNYSAKPTIIFPAFVTGLEAEIGAEDKVSCTATFKVAGAITYTQGS